MGKINETLTLTDQFSASFHTFIRLGEQALSSLTSVNEGLTDFAAQSVRESEKTRQSIDGVTQSINQMSDALQYISIQGMNEIHQTIQQIGASQRRHTEETKRTTNAAGELLKTFRQIAVATGAVSLVKSFLGVADQQTQTNARLNLMNDGLQSVADLQDMIYASSQRTRTEYATTAQVVAGLGQRAGDAFSSSAEIIQFAENLNKQFKIAGASQQEISSASLQLTQALGSGVLRGEELNAIFEAAPNIIQTIADYLGEPIGNIRQMAADGQISAEVVKNAMLWATDEINEQFEEMPMTLSEAFIVGKNAIQKSLQDSFSGWSEFLNSDEGQKAIMRVITLFTVLAQVGVGALSALGQGALWVSDNLDFILPILAAIGVALVILNGQAILTGLANVKSALASAAAWSVAHWPLLLLVAVLSVAMIAAQQFGFGMQEVGSLVGSALGFIYAIGYNVFASLWNVIATFAEFFANVWNDPLGATARLFFDVFDAILGIVETTAGAIDALLGTDMAGAVSGFRSKMAGWVDDTFGENAIQIKRMSELDVAATTEQFGNYGANLGAKLDNIDFSLESLTENLGGLNGFDASSIPTSDNLGDIGKVGKVGKIEDDVKLSDEDVKLYRDLAERRYMNQIELKTLAPNISISIPESAAKNLTAQDIADKLKVLLIEQMSAQTAVSHG